MNASQINDGAVLGPAAGFSVINPMWGDERIVSARFLTGFGVDPDVCGLEKVSGGFKIYLHFGVPGDWVLQSLDNRIDTYRVGKVFFESTYET